MPTEYANPAACRAAGVEPVPQPRDRIKHKSLGSGIITSIQRRKGEIPVSVGGLGEPDVRLNVTFDNRGPKELLWPFAYRRTTLIARGDVTIPQHSDTPEGT